MTRPPAADRETEVLLPLQVVAHHLTRLEAQLRAIASRVVDGNGRGADDGAMTGFGEAMDQIHDRLDALRRLVDEIAAHRASASRSSRSLED